MAMDIRLCVHALLAIIYVRYSYGLDSYICTWPHRSIAQLKCNTNCPILKIDKVTVGRLYGAVGDCGENNANIETRKPLPSCNYELPQNNDFLVQLQRNCTSKPMCDVYSFNKLFQRPGNCGHEDNNSISNMRNWLHIEYSCRAEISGRECEFLPMTTESTTQTTTTVAVPTTTEAEATTKRMANRNRPVVPAKPEILSTKHIITIVIPALAACLFLAILLIIATMLYRQGICRTKSWIDRLQQRQRKRNSLTQQYSYTSNGKPAKQCMDAGDLKSLEKRLKINNNRNGNDYESDLQFSQSINGLNKFTSSKRPTFKKHVRCNSLDNTLDRANAAGTPEGYYSDSSITTCTSDENFDLQGNRRRNGTLPPLPKPQIGHSEVYFTETETESEAPKRSFLPVLLPPPPPKINRGLKPERGRSCKTPQDNPENVNESSSKHGRHSPTKQSVHHHKRVAGVSSSAGHQNNPHANLERKLTRKTPIERSRVVKQNSGDKSHDNSAFVVDMDTMIPAAVHNGEPPTRSSIARHNTVCGPHTPGWSHR